MSVPKEVIKKVKLLELKTRKLVDSTFSGQYHSSLRGQGMTFSDFREYVAGDDVRAISWPLSARTGKVYIKQYEEERDLTILLMVDVSGSLDFGSRHQLKGEAINHMAALIGFAAARNNDNVGLLMFSDHTEKFIPPKKGRAHVQRLLTELYAYKPKSLRTDLRPTLSDALGYLKKKAHIFIFSDFIAEDFSLQLKSLGKKHDTVAIILEDQAEVQLPAVGLLELYDPETGHIMVVDTESRAYRQEFATLYEQQKQKRESELRKSSVPLVYVKNAEDSLEQLIAYFRKRAAR